MNLIQSVSSLAVVSGVVFCTDLHAENFITLFVSILQNDDKYSGAVIAEVYNAMLILLFNYKQVTAPPSCPWINICLSHYHKVLSAASDDLGDKRVLCILESLSSIAEHGPNLLGHLSGKAERSFDNLIEVLKKPFADEELDWTREAALNKLSNM